MWSFFEGKYCRGESVNLKESSHRQRRMDMLANKVIQAYIEREI